MASQHRSCRRACPAGPVLFRWGSGGLLGGVIDVFNGLADPSAVGEFVAVLLHPRRNLCRLWVPAVEERASGARGLLGCARRPAMMWGRRVSRSSCVLAVNRSISCRRPPTLNCTVSSAGPSSMVVLQEDLHALGLHNTLPFGLVTYDLRDPNPGHTEPKAKKKDPPPWDGSFSISSVRGGRLSPTRPATSSLRIRLNYGKCNRRRSPGDP